MRRLTETSTNRPATGWRRSYSRRVISGALLARRDSELGTIRRALSGTGNHSRVVIVGTESARALPLGAFIGLLGEAMSDPLTNVRRVINLFVTQQRRGRVVIGVDDAHLLDGLSALVIHQLAQSGGARLVVTLRTGTEEPDAVMALWKDRLLARLDLG